MRPATPNQQRDPRERAIERRALFVRSSATVSLALLCVAATASAQVKWTMPGNLIPALIHHAVAYDSARQQVVLFGGRSASRHDETWVWGGTLWTEQQPAMRPSERESETSSSKVRSSRRLRFCQ